MQAVTRGPTRPDLVLEYLSYPSRPVAPGSARYCRGAALLRFRILTVNGLVFQTQVAYIIPLVGVFFGYLILDEIITWRVLVSLSLIILGIYIVKKNNKGYKK